MRYGGSQTRLKTAAKPSPQQEEKLMMIVIGVVVLALIGAGAAFFPS